MLGHADPGFTLRTYTHATNSMQVKEANTVDAFIANKLSCKNFRAILQLIQSQSIILSKKTETDLISRAGGDRMKLLLAEDEKRMAQALKELLRLEGYEVDHVTDGASAGKFFIK